VAVTEAKHEACWKLPQMALFSLALAVAFHALPMRQMTGGRVVVRATAPQDELNGLDADYPWRFDGRLWFRPALVRSSDSLPEGLSALSLFGWTIGGVVALGKVRRAISSR
jgi:hypothetical protein